MTKWRSRLHFFRSWKGCFKQRQFFLHCTTQRENPIWRPKTKHLRCHQLPRINSLEFNFEIPQWMSRQMRDFRKTVPTTEYIRCQTGWNNRKSRPNNDSVQGLHNFLQQRKKILTECYIGQVVKGEYWWQERASSRNPSIARGGQNIHSENNISCAWLPSNRTVPVQSTRNELTTKNFMLFWTEYVN